MDLSSLVSGKLSIDYPAPFVVRVTLDDPDKRNAIDEVLHEDLAHIWPLIDKDPAIRAAIITGRGKAFCGGGTVSDAAQAEDAPTAFARQYDSVLRLVRNMVDMRTPLVAAINGPAVGAGLALALLSDISIAAEDARLNEGHLQNGLVAGDHAALIWPLLCGLAKTKYHVLLGEPMTGREAAACNLISLAVPKEELEAKSIATATRLAQMAPTAMRMTKHVLNHWLRQAMPVFELSAALELAMLQGAESAEAVGARMQKRTPAFKEPSRF
jgi:enoyl-CoA hydratase